MLEIDQCCELKKLTVYAVKIPRAIRSCLLFWWHGLYTSSKRLKIFKWLDFNVGTFCMGNITSLRFAHISLVKNFGLGNAKLSAANAKNFLNCLASAKSLHF